ncbi:MAG TPA: SigE family RNA polymerase sigma factor [Segeticoccus sp.]|uniref:SigE family RNA polymerase sigma factor n=1 Tax=Segeticoccus sp. TaxID=2706531 RepID=UPI002D7F1C3C|nr:SigE family RNA polymerase sigma factor [Segeticoccus sp.]HET8599588.1 SigE family RNA polymerase sigma factor [Segeticoccus sp.]
MAPREVATATVRWSADDALTHLYAAHWHSLVRLSYLLVRDQQVAEETVQDAFVAMHHRWHLLREPEQALAYLRRCVVNGSRSVLRHRGVEERHLRSLPDDTRRDLGSRSTVASAEQHALDHDTGDRLCQALAALPRRQREVLTLRYYLDLSEAQIADALQISPGSVKVHAHRGLEALRSMEEVDRP